MQPLSANVIVPMHSASPIVSRGGLVQAALTQNDRRLVISLS